MVAPPLFLFLSHGGRRAALGLQTGLDVRSRELVRIAFPLKSHAGGFALLALHSRQHQGEFISFRSMTGDANILPLMGRNGRHAEPLQAGLQSQSGAFRRAGHHIRAAPVTGSLEQSKARKLLSRAAHQEEQKNADYSQPDLTRE